MTYTVGYFKCDPVIINRGSTNLEWTWTNYVHKKKTLTEQAEKLLWSKIPLSLWMNLSQCNYYLFIINYIFNIHLFVSYFSL